jgi:hypothetical protein
MGGINHQSHLVPNSKAIHNTFYGRILEGTTPVYYDDFPLARLQPMLESGANTMPFLAVLLGFLSQHHLENSTNTFGALP